MSAKGFITTLDGTYTEEDKILMQQLQNPEK